jgi:SAM-dependent methyltransferase
MTLEKLKAEWEALAKRDSLWAILTDASKASGGWDLAEFMATGEAEIAVVLGYVRGLGLELNFDGTALDFGCGVGRLTQPLTRRFARCAGVDISSQMIAEAEAMNESPRCRYVVSADARLPFADESFSFVYSNIVLQHMPSVLAEGYLQEFMRVLEPGGVMVFGVQDLFVMPDMKSRVTRARQILRVKSRLKEALGVGSGDMHMHLLGEPEVRRAIGTGRVMDVQFTNTAAKDFNGKLVYLDRAPRAGFVGKQYCVVK